MSSANKTGSASKTEHTEAEHINNKSVNQNIKDKCLKMYTYSSITQTCETKVSQGGISSHLRCGGTVNNHCFTNLVLSLIMKEFWKSAIILWSYGQDYSSTLFWLMGTLRWNEITLLKPRFPESINHGCSWQTKNATSFIPATLSHPHV